MARRSAPFGTSLWYSQQIPPASPLTRQTRLHHSSWRSPRRGRPATQSCYWPGSERENQKQSKSTDENPETPAGEPTTATGSNISSSTTSPLSLGFLEKSKLISQRAVEEECLNSILMNTSYKNVLLSLGNRFANPNPKR